MAGEAGEKRIGAGLAPKERDIDAAHVILINQHRDMATRLQHLGQAIGRVETGRDQRAHRARAHLHDRVVGRSNVRTPIEHVQVQPVLLGYIGRKLPVFALSREPQFDVPQLDHAHDVAERRPVAVLLGHGERCQDEADEKRTNHGKIFHFRSPFHQSHCRPARRSLSLARMEGPSIDPGSSLT